MRTCIARAYGCTYLYVDPHIHRSEVLSKYVPYGGEGDGKNATPLQKVNWFDRFVAVKEVFEVGKSALFRDYRDVHLFTGGFTL
jgi:hypothetical protein